MPIIFGGTILAVIESTPRFEFQEILHYNYDITSEYLSNIEFAVSDPRYRNFLFSTDITDTGRYSPLNLFAICYCSLNYIYRIAG